MSEVKKFTTDCEIYHECTAVYNKMKKLKAELAEANKANYFHAYGCANYENQELTKLLAAAKQENLALKELVKGVLRGDNMNLSTSTDWLTKATKLTGEGEG